MLFDTEKVQSAEPAYKRPRVAILMATYNGETYIAEQLQSIIDQTHPHWSLHVSDDGSTDGTLACLKQQLSALPSGKWSLTQGPGKGFAGNFLHLLSTAADKGDYFACSDQDDIWHSDKLARALQYLQSVAPEIPAAYFSRSLLVDSQNQALGLSTPFSKALGFHNALVQSIGGGNTLVMNESARQLVCAIDSNTPIVSHDWWTYILVSGCGGQVFFDSVPSLRYRQHGNNVSGQNNGLSAKLVRLKMLASGIFREWNDINLQAISQLEEKLAPENRVVLDHFRQARQGGPIHRIRHLHHSRVYRQNRLDNLLMYLSALLKLL